MSPVSSEAAEEPVRCDGRRDELLSFGPIVVYSAFFKEKGVAVM